jgi:alanine racemase
VTGLPREAARSPHRAWIEIDHAGLVENLSLVHRLAGAEKQVIAVVKANAYGHGAIEVSRTLLAHGVERLAVATVDEGLALRAASIEAPILVLWGLGAPHASPAVAADL